MLKTIKCVTSTLLVLIVGIYVLDVMNVSTQYRELFGVFILGSLLVNILFEENNENKTYK